MEILESMNEHVRRFSILDVKLAQLSSFFIAFVIAAFIPDIV